MQMGNGLLAFFATVEHRAISPMQPFVGRDFLGAQEEMSDQLLIVIRQIVQRWDRLPRYNQNVNRCLGLNVPKCNALFILVHHIRRDLTIGNLLKQGLFGHDRDALT